MSTEQTINPRFTKAENSQESAFNKLSTDFTPRATDEIVRRELTWTGEESSPEAKSISQDKVAEKEALILGRFKNQDALVKSYRELEKDFTRNRQAQSRLTEAEQELAKLREENRKLNRVELPSTQQLNEHLAVDPAEAIRAEFERQRQIDEDRKAEDRLKQYENEIKSKIQGNISSMESEYTDFSDNRSKFAEWMSYYGMDSTSIMSDKVKAEHAYRDFLDANTDPTPQVREEVLQESLEKQQQMPSYAGSGVVGSHPSNRPTNQRFTRLGEEPQAVEQAPGSVSSIDLMEDKMGLGRRGGWF